MRSWPSSTVSLPVWKHLYGTLMLNSLGLPFLPLTVCVKNDPDFLARASLKLICRDRTRVEGGESEWAT
eukprot:254350-Hanusia_phi.AAC.1